MVAFAPRKRGITRKTEKYSGEVAEWSIAAVLKTAVLKGTVGSNPTLSANLSCTTFMSLKVSLPGSFISEAQPIPTRGLPHTIQGGFAPPKQAGRGRVSYLKNIPIETPPRVANFISNPVGGVHG